MKRRGGFSLIEMIVVIGLMAITTGIGTSVFIQMNDNWHRVRRAAELEGKAETIFAAIRKDAENLLAPELTGIPVTANIASYRDTRQFNANAFVDGSLLMPVYTTLGSEQRITAARVQYRIDHSGTVPKLVRTTGTLYDDDPKGNAETIAEGVYAFAVQMPGDEKPLPGETGPPPRLEPGLIRLSVLVADDAYPLDQIARTAVIPLRVE